MEFFFFFFTPEQKVIINNNNIVEIYFFFLKTNKQNLQGPLHLLPPLKTPRQYFPKKKKKTDSEYRDGKMPNQRPKLNKKVHRATLWAKTFVHFGLMIENQSLSWGLIVKITFNIYQSQYAALIN